MTQAIATIIVSGIIVPMAVGCVGFIIGRQSLWGRLQAAEGRAKADDESADLIKIGSLVYDDAMSCLIMTACVGEAYGYQRMSYIRIGSRKRVRITYEVES